VTAEAFNLKAERLCSIIDIREVLYTHSRGIDRADLNLLDAAYHDNAQVDYGFFQGGAREFARILIPAQAASAVTTHRHQMPWITVDGESAISESYVIACAAGEDDGLPVQRIIGGRYLDTLKRHHGEWKLAFRRYVMDFNINLPDTGSSPMLQATLANFVPRGGHGAADVGIALLALGQVAKGTGERIEMSESTENKLSAALDKIELNELMSKYCRGVDRCDTALLQDIFEPDAEVVTGAINGSGADFSAGIGALVSQNMDRVFHSVSNQYIELNGDKAVSETYVIASSTAGGSQSVFTGRYLNSFRKRDGVWRITRHVWVQDWDMTHPSTDSSDGMYEALNPRGCFGREDPVYAHWQTL